MTSYPWTLVVAVGSLLLIAFGPQSLESQCSAEVQGDTDFQGHADFGRDVRPLLQKHCYPCHSGDEVHGDVDFRLIISTDDVAGEFETWESVVKHLNDGTMPPADEPQPTLAEREPVLAWYLNLIQSVKARPAVLKPRRLSVIEYRNTLRSVFGFDLEVAIIEAEQTLAERSLVIKLLPTDPPGKSGFKNDTHANPLTTVVWDQYSYLIDAATEQLFSLASRPQLESFVGQIKGDRLSSVQASELLRKIVTRAWRRTLPTNQIERTLAKLDGKQDAALVDAVKFEIKAALMSPQFI